MQKKKSHFRTFSALAILGLVIYAEFSDIVYGDFDNIMQYTSTPTPNPTPNPTLNLPPKTKNENGKLPVLSNTPKVNSDINSEKTVPVIVSTTPVGSAKAQPPSSPTKVPGLFSSDVATHDNAAPLNFKGDSLEGARDSGYAILNGNVVLIQADTTIKSERAELFSKPGTTDFERALIKGNVVIEKKPTPLVPKIVSTSAEVEYFVAQRKAILKGNPKVIRGLEVIQGEIIELFMDTGQVKIIGARGVIDPNTQQGMDTSNKRPSNKSTSTPASSKKKK